jgi:methylated-DNA-[protein]-cysteine S-methyltransferase
MAHHEIPGQARDDVVLEVIPLHQLCSLETPESNFMFIDTMNTPIGTLVIKATAQGISWVDFIETEEPEVKHNEITSRCKQQLQEYFDGKRKSFDLPLDQQGTNFQKSIWDCLSRIPFGQAVSYRDIADMVNNRKAVRAVGAANGKNPIAIIVPCHRVIGTDRTLTGYAGGLRRKAWLLKHEGIAFKDNQECHQPDAQSKSQADLFEQ